MLGLQGKPYLLLLQYLAVLRGIVDSRQRPKGSRAKGSRAKARGQVTSLPKFTRGGWGSPGPDTMPRCGSTPSSCYGTTLVGGSIREQLQ